MAVIIAVWPVKKVPAVAVNVALLDPAGTKTVTGTGRSVELLESVTVAPPAGAACVSVTVHVAVAPELRPASGHPTELSDGPAPVPVTERTNSTGGSPLMSAMTVVTEPAALAPSVKLTDAVPVLSVVAVEAESNPVPAVTPKCTTALGTGFPELSIALTTNGFGNGELACPDWGVPETICSSAGNCCA